VIEGEKIFITYAESCDAVLVLARLVHPERRGLSAFMVEKGTPGLSVGRQFRKMGIRFEDTAPLAFSACRVPAFNHIDGDLKSMLRSFSESRPVVAAYALGVTRAALDFTWGRLSEIGITLDDEKGPTETTAAADRLMSLEAEWEATWVVVLQAKWIEQNEGPGKIESSMAKAMGGGLARRATQTCIDVLGVCGLSASIRSRRRFATPGSSTSRREQASCNA
jgi:acyl-CoA dehydrogenase